MRIVNTKAHWESVYRFKAQDAVSWYKPHLDASINFIERYAKDRSAAVLDVGGGESTLVDDLLNEGFKDLTVLDVSETA